MSTNWRVYGKDTVACKLSRAELPVFFGRKYDKKLKKAIDKQVDKKIGKSVVVGPHEAAIVVKNGQVEYVVTEAKVKTTGFLDRLAGMFGKGPDLEVYFVDLAPIQFSIFLGQSTKGQVATEQSHRADVDTRVETLDTFTDIASSTDFGWGEEFDASGISSLGYALQGDLSAGITSGSAAGVSKASVAEDASVRHTEKLDVSEVNIIALSLDNEVINAECLFRVVVDIEEAHQFVSLLKGKAALASWDLAGLVRDELLARILIPEIATHRADELRGNRDLLSRLEQQVAEKLGGAFANSGMTLESFSINWGLTEQEIAEINRKRQERHEAAAKFAHQRQLSQMSRVQEIQKTRLTNLQELKVAATTGDEELKDLLLAGEIHRDLMVTGKQVDEARIDAQVREIELDIEQREAQSRLQSQRAEEMMRLDIEDREWRQQNEKRLAEIDADDKEMGDMVRMQIQMATAKHERKTAERRQEIDADCRRQQTQLDSEFQQRKLKLDESMARMGMMERLVSEGLRAGAADASVLKTMLEQSTEQEYATTSDAKVQARSDAEAAKHNLETHKEAEDRERKHQKETTDQAAQMMQASKQTPGSTVVAGGGAAAVPPASAQPPNVNIVNVPGGQPAGEAPASPPAATSQCPSCQAPTQPGWKACPACGQVLATGSKFCTGCGKPTEPNWKACPECGQKL